MKKIKKKNKQKTGLAMFEVITHSEGDRKETLYLDVGCKVTFMIGSMEFITLTLKEVV